MLKPKIEQALNDQINAELYSSYLYLSMAAWFEDQNLPGMAGWMQLQSREEYGHAMKFFGYIQERNGRVRLAQIDAPKLDWESPLNVFEEALAHEQYITDRIDQLVNLAVDEKDHATNNFLQWFVTEQVEEEATVTQIVDKLKVIGDNPVARFMVDRELAQRAPAPAGPAAG